MGSKDEAGMIMVESPKFYEMHQNKVEYDTRDVDKVLPVHKVIAGLPTVGLKVPMLYDRPSGERLLGTGRISSPVTLKPGEALVTVKFLGRQKKAKTFGGKDGPSPVFFFAYQNYEKTRLEYQQMLWTFCQDPENYELYLDQVFQIPLGGMYAVKADEEDKYFRVRIIGVNLDTENLDYWAVDNALFGTCPPTELYILNEALTTLPMLAVPGIFGQDPSPSKLEKFDSAMKPYCLAKVQQPIYRYDSGVRKVELI